MDGEGVMIDVGILLCCAVVRRTDGWGLGAGAGGEMCAYCGQLKSEVQQVD